VQHRQASPGPTAANIQPMSENGHLLSQLEDSTAGLAPEVEQAIGPTDVIQAIVFDQFGRKTL